MHKIKENAKTMKRFLLSLVIITLIFVIFMFPQETMTYAATGLTLWFDNMVPALFPFMVISSLIIRLDIAPYIVSFLHPVLKLLFRTDLYCEYAIVMGFLCGFPMGAIVIGDLLKEEKITQPQADYLLSFCNNIGPVFFCTIVLPIFKPEYHFLLLFGMYGIPLFYGIIMRFIYRKAFNDIPANTYASTQMEEHFSTAFREALNNAVSSSLYLGACMIFFNMLRFIPAYVFKENLLAQALSSWMLEVNGAVSFTGTLYSKGVELFSLCMMPFLTLGGLSCIAQTAGILNETNCSLSKYIIHKIIQLLLWLLLTLLWLLIHNLPVLLWFYF